MNDESENKTQLISNTKVTPDPFTLVIFGASGDLTKRKLIPAVFRLYLQNLLPQKVTVFAFARTENSNTNFRHQMRQAVQKFAPHISFSDKNWQNFAQNLFYFCGNYQNNNDFRQLRQKLQENAQQKNIPCNYLFNIATPPSVFIPIVKNIHAAELSHCSNSSGDWARVIIEKPFGHDLQSALTLNRCIKEAFAEKQVFRIDHFLGKEAVQNLMVFRFANSIFEPLWNKHYIDHVQITVSETVGIENRASYFDGAGTIRDMVQNHMMHLLTLVAMEPPASLQADCIRDEKVKVLRALRPVAPQCFAKEVVRGQYVAGTVGGKAVFGYRQEAGVAGDSATETYVALKAMVDNWRWSGVPFYLRSGKRMPARISEIDIHFQQVPRVLFNTAAMKSQQPNMLAIRIQPNEGITLRFQVKVPGAAMRIDSFKMDFGYAESFGQSPPDAYERLLLDAALGDTTLFTRSDEVEAAWQFLTPILECSKNQPASSLSFYPAGSWGPREADNLLTADGRKWGLIHRPVPGKS